MMMITSTTRVMTIEEALKLKIERQGKFHASSSPGPTISSSSPGLHVLTPASQTGSLVFAIQVVSFILLLLILAILLFLTFKCVFSHYIRKKPKSTLPLNVIQEVGQEFKKNYEQSKEIDSISQVL